MWNKMFVSSLLLLVFVAGFQHYDKYITEKGEVPLVSQFIDYIDFIQFEDPLEEDRSFVKSESFEFQLEEPRVIKERIEQLNNQRMQILNERREFLSQIKQLNIDILEEALVYAKTIVSEGIDIMARFPEFDQLSKDIINAKNITDPTAQALEFKRIQDEIWNITTNVVDNPDTDIPRLRNFYTSIQAMLNEIPDVLIQNCADITLEKCIEDSDDVQADLAEMMESIASGPTLETTERFVDLLYDEYKVMAGKYDSGERSLFRNSITVETEFKRLVMDLHKNFDAGVSVMRSIQKELYSDQAMILAYNKDFEERIKNTRRDIQKNQVRISPPERPKISLFRNRPNDLQKNRSQRNSIQKLKFKSDINIRSIRSPHRTSRNSSDNYSRQQQKERQRMLKERIRNLKSRQKDYKKF